METTAVASADKAAACGYSSKLTAAGKLSNLQSKVISATFLQLLLSWNTALRCEGGELAVAIAD